MSSTGRFEGLPIAPLAGAFAKWVKAIDDRARAAMEAKVAEMELERDALHREREEVGSAVFENGRLTERVDALATELEAAKVKIAESERRTEEAARVGGAGTDPRQEVLGRVRDDSSRRGRARG
jgi:hypothetical protein